MVSEHYFGRSFAMLRRDKGWLKPLLALSAANLVPIVGPLGVSGYAMEWARLTAWGVDAAPKQKGVRVGECIGSGWRAFVVMFVPGFVFGLVSGLLNGLASLTNAGSLRTMLGVLLPFCQLILTVVATVCALHATVYQSFRAGFSYRRIGQMLGEDFGGIMRLAAMNVLLSLVVGLAVGVLASVTLGMAVGDVVSRYQMWFYADVLETVTWAQMFGFVADLFAQMGAYALPLALIVLVGNVAAVLTKLIVVNAVGLWMRKFDVPHWGAMNEPLRRPQPLQLPYPGTPMGI